MNSRQLNKRIQIWSSSQVADGFGGMTTNTALVSTSWAKIESISPGEARNIVSYGIDDPQKSYKVTVRKRNDLTYNSEEHFVKYRGNEYAIISEPTNVDFKDTTIRFIMKQVSNSSNEAVTASATAPTITVTDP